MTDAIRACCTPPVKRPNLPPGFEEMAADTSRLWTPGQTLRIAFRGGRRADRNAVMVAASIWMHYANIHFVQSFNGSAEIRCSFDRGGSWSLVGRDSLLADPNGPTVNMGWPDDPARDLHELGHALGLIHEHQSPAAGIPWRRETVYLYYWQTQGWSRSDVDEQVFDRYTQSTVTNTAWDPHSIMEYPIPAQLVENPAYAVGWNQSLSTRDKLFISTLYPGKS